MSSTFDKKTSIANGDAKMKFKHQIALAKQNKISWEDLALILDVLTPTFLSMKQLIKTLLEELKISLNNQNAKPTESEDVENKVIKTESEEVEDAQNLEHMDEVESGANDVEMKKDVLDTGKVQIPTNNESSNDESFAEHLMVENPEKPPVENDLEADTLEDEDMDEVESAHSEEQIDSKVSDSTEKEISNKEGLTENSSSTESEKQFTFQNDVTESRNDQKPDSRIDLKCELCTETFSHKNQLKYHYRFIHDLSSKEVFKGQLYTFVGDNSQERFDADDYNQSLNHDPQSDESKNNEDCTNETENTSKINTFKCVICGICFNFKSDFERHERIHTGEKPFKCKSCQKRFAQSGHLIFHERTHTGEKPFICKTCKKAFARKCVLKIHERTHTGEKSYQCKTCKKAFASLFPLKEHERIHTSEKPYQCKICGKTFSDGSNFRRHEKNCHKRRKSKNVFFNNM